MKPSALHVLFLCLALCDGLPAAGNDAANWSQFRGPSGSGVANTFKPPVKIDASQAVWRTPLPLGKSSPVLWGSRVFLTGVEGGRLATLALDAKSGKVLWKKLAPEVRLESVHAANSAAASTPCVDEDRVYVYFGSYGLLCYDHDGRGLWQKAIPTPQSMYGVSTSPILHD
ncbi:MAG: PQQ-binding-like beta-propeller repeat protein, partial [Verrucomicrobia bacterium]|nr:PQQ-binding-like beta-propeller repeat protein [Verrucomicrobiota bacterium]